MRYELRLTAYDVLEDVLVSAVVYEKPDDDQKPTERVWATSVQFRGRGTAEATEWTREALLGLLRAL